MFMTNEVRGQVKVRLRTKSMSQRQLGLKADIMPANITRMLNGSHNLTSAWERILSVLELELIAVPKEKLEAVRQVLESSDNQ